MQPMSEHERAQACATPCEYATTSAVNMPCSLIHSHEAYKTEIEADAHNPNHSQSELVCRLDARDDLRQPGTMWDVLGELERPATSWNALEQRRLGGGTSEIFANQK